MLIVMALHGSMGSLVLIIAVRRYQYGSHHGKRAERRRNHVAHHIPVIVLACPDISAFRLHNAGNRIIDQGIEVYDACRFELLIIFRVIDFLENVLERMVILLGDRVFCRKPQILLRIQGIVKAASCKTCDGLAHIMHSLHDSLARKIMYQFLRLSAILSRIDQFYLAGPRNLHLRAFIYIAVCVSGNGDRLLPVFHARLDSLYHDWRAEYGSIQDRADGAVGAFPHFFQIILCHACRIGSNGRAFYRDLVFFRRIGGIHRNLVVGLIPVLQSQVIIFRIQFDKRLQKILFYHLPEDPGHLVAVHLDNWCCHLNLCHLAYSPSIVSFPYEDFPLPS